ncbi:hypothetical protein ASPTUDRAFT_476892 [Aspergillus tubingensis CBS 134.48]|uniref:Uncharacterized protein n=1 Tax=Aspergillus tubingensis (strain CBS 134.48) TaxID=767770 RepID=A0A1L9NB98_ASPTC|nr:hypothetical protein ASPTUDRAFT_476892 [Aspergillus tubingensis CBS 134.48]
MVVGRPNCRSNKRQSFLVVILISAKLPGSRVRTPGDSRVGIPAKSGMKVDGGIEKNQKMKRIAREKNKKKSQGDIIGQRKGRASREAWGSLAGGMDGWRGGRSGEPAGVRETLRTVRMSSRRKTHWVTG